MKSIVSNLVAIAIMAIGFTGLVQAQNTVSGYNITISNPGSYILGNGSTYGITINASNVVLDLAGHNVTSNGNGQCNLINSGNSPGCTPCTNCTSSLPGISATGTNIVIKNGIVSGQYGDGISIYPPNGGTQANVTIEDVTVSNNTGYGVNINGNGAVLTNVTASQNAKDGIVLQNNVRLSHITANYNNGNGINGAVGSGTFNDVTATYNQKIGVIANGSMSHFDVGHNGGAGIYAQGVLRDVNAEFNGGDGVVANNYGVVLGAASTFNTGNGFTLSSHTCYTGLSASTNTGTNISGGTPLVGNAASCN